MFPTPVGADPEAESEKPQSPTESQQQAEDTTAESDRCPRRGHKLPSHLADFYVDNGSDDSHDYCYFMNIPISYEEAVNLEDSDKRKQAMDEEFNSLEINDTFKVTELPEDKEVVGGKWVYTVKGNNENPIYKARYVAKGYSQVATVRMESIRSLMQIAAQENWTLHQMDVKGAYLHAPIECDVYVQQPQGYRNPSELNLVWKPNKLLYGLKQSGRNWHNLLHEYLIEMDLKQSAADPCVFMPRSIDETAVLLVWVDDIIVAAGSLELLNNVKHKLRERFNMKDLGKLSIFLGIEFE